MGHSTSARHGFAMLGYALRFPGAADSSEFWRLMAEGRDAVSVVPPDRWDADEFFDPDPDAPGKMVARRAGFVDDVSGFDAPFFGVSAREAMFMDPQHRLMLETTWSAVEHAGMSPASLAGTQTGVFMGLSTHEFAGMIVRLSRLEDIDFYSGTGCSPAAGAGRISFRLGLRGPAVIVDTACSSSLVALHQACQALDAGDCDLALVGGVNVILTPIPMINFSRARMLAPDGRCKTFDAAADGYVRGEGCGVVVLKRVEDATRDGDSIRAVIRGTAVNQDGASGGLTVPNGIAQQQVIRTALRRAGIDAADVDYLEAHGTGTPLGDPIEAQAAGAVFGEGRDPDRPLLVGSVKTNIGHLEAASGIAGVIKVALALEHELLPRHLHFRDPSPYIPWDRLPLRVVDEATQWRRNERPRIAGVSSFGFSGTNAHVLIEEAAEVDPAATDTAAPARMAPTVLPLSAGSAEALTTLASRYRDWMHANPDAALSDVCATAGAARAHLEHRAALVVDSRAKARRLLGALREDRPAPGLTRGVCAGRPKTAWLFPGQGSQYAGMGTALFESEPVFRETVTRCLDLLEGALPQRLSELMFDADAVGKEALLDTTFAQPALFVLEMALARLWQSWGIEPDVLVGHSVGQYAAACVAGVFSIDDGIRLIAERGRLFGGLPTGGRMMAVFADVNTVEERAAEFPRVSVAAYNGASTVLSGPEDDVQRVAAPLSASGIRCEWLETSHAFHSALLDPALDEFESYAHGVDFSPPQLTLICNRSGKVLTRHTAPDARYWRQHARQPVRFADSVATLAELGCAMLMEIGPQPILSASAMRIWPETAPTPQAVASLRRDADGDRCMAEALAAAYVSGHQLDFAGRRVRPKRPVDLPTYPFQHRTYWFPAYTAPELNDRARAGTSWSGETQAGAVPLGEESGSRPNDPASGDVDVRQPIEPRLDRVTELVLEQLGQTLRTPAADIDPRAEFISLGMDSLSAMELHRRLQAGLGIEIPASLFFAHPTAAALAEALLAAYMRRSGDVAHGQTTIPRVPRDGDLPLSHAQEQLWFLHELLPSSSAYNVAARVDFPGSVDRVVLQRSLDAVVARHEVLRTSFRSVRGVPHPIIVEHRPVELAVEQVNTDTDVTAIAEREAAVPFDIAVEPLLRARLLVVGDQRQVLVLTMHHIVTDGWSFRVLLRDLGITYQALERGETIPLTDLPIQYVDYAQWQREQLLTKAFEAHLGFWREELAGAPPLELDTDRPRPKIPTFRGARTHFELGSKTAAALRELCRAENVTVSIPLLATLAALMGRYSGQDDVVVGTLTANRTRIETVDLVGLFVNALPVRIRLDGELDGAELLARVRHRMVEVLAHQDVPFDLVVNAMAPERTANRNPLFSVQLVVQPASGDAQLSGLGLQVAEIDTRTAKRDLTFTFFDDDRLTGHVEYAADVFDAVRIDRMIVHFRSFLEAIASDTSIRVSEIPFLTEPESCYHHGKQSSRTTTARSIPELFESSVDRAPDAVAVSAGDRSLSYQQLDAAANGLARRLRARGVDVGTAVGLCVGRTPSMVIGMLGILKAGGVYVPIDPSYPKDHADEMLADAGVLVLVGDDDIDGLDAGPDLAERLETELESDHLAYIMYTSGSTGRPKGVAITHGSVVEYVETLGREVGIAPDDVYLQTASISFSSSIRQLLVPLAVGAQVVVATSGERRDPTALLHRMGESAVTVADLVPTVVRGLIDALELGSGERSAPPNRLRLLLTASEPLRAGLVRAWRRRFGSAAVWINMYGQTETTGIVSLQRVDRVTGSDHGVVPIGRPRGNVCMYVLDGRLRQVPPGISGELFVAGQALARGYVGDDELTARKFVRAPWDPDQRLYASGDVVRLGWDGTIEFRNRTDRQVKIRGLRVEPAEIDRVLLEHPRVREAVTVALHPDDEVSVLAAYVSCDGEPVSVSELRAHAHRQLPKHMIPSTFLVLDRLPQTANGKLDRAALPDVAAGRDEEVQYVAPRGTVENCLADIWRTTLGVERVSAGDNFFELGGHSLLAAQVRSRIHQRLGIDLPLDALFDDQTLADLARRIEETSADDAEAPPLRPVSRAQVLPASYVQELMWHAEREDPGSPAHWIDVSIRITGAIDAAVIARAVQSVVQRQEVLRTTFPSSATSLSQKILDSHLLDVPILEAGADRCNESVGQQWRDLDTRPPFRPEVTRLADWDHILRLRVHRILADGYAMRLLLREIGVLVARSLGLDAVPLPEGRLQYADYAVWERTWLTGEALARRVDHFRRQFASCDLASELLTDHSRTGTADRRGRQFGFEFPPAVAATARALALRERVSLYTVLLAAFAAALGSHAGRCTVVLSAPTSRRTHPVMQQIVGPFMNTVPLRIELDPGEDLPALVGKVKNTVSGALSNQDAPWHHVLAALEEQHGPSARGIGQVAFLMDDPVPGEFAAGGFGLARVPPERIVLRRDVTVAMSTGDDTITGTVTYDEGLFEITAIESIVSHFIAALTVSPSRID